MDSGTSDSRDFEQEPSADDTVQSDEFPPAVNRTPPEPEPEPEAGDQTIMLPNDGAGSTGGGAEDAGEQTIMFSESDSGEQDPGTGGLSDPGESDGDGGESSSSNSETFISDDSFDPPEILMTQPSSLDSSFDAANSMSDTPTVSSQDGAFGGSDSASDSPTIVSDDDFEMRDPGATYQSDPETNPAGDDDSMQTFVSDGDVGDMIDRTWGAAVNDGTDPAMTIKAVETFDPISLKHDSIPLRRLEEQSKSSAGEYELMKVLGEGGMGIVWNARQRSVERSVAIKMIKSSISAKAKQTEKFVAEAIVTGDLEHPNIVPIHELGKDQHNNYFYAMKHVQGTPWNKVIRSMQLHENLDALLRTCDAIAFAHARGIIHRDLKPENIMLGDFGEVLVMDWGLALPTAEFSKKDRISRAHGMGGTPAYMAPEMATGPITRVNYTSDVYLLGAILFEIVTGSPPHRGKTTQQCLAAAMRNVITKTDEDNELLEIARKAMHTDTAQRYQTVKQFQQAVRNYLAHEKSLQISRRAEQELNEARQSGDYTHYARSLFGFEEASALWLDNEDANEGLLTARLEYAQAAFGKEDFDLAESLTDTTDPQHEPLIQAIQKAKQDRLTRQRTLRLAKAGIAALAAVIFVIVGVSYYLINEEVERAVAAEKVATEAGEEEAAQRLIAEEKTAVALEQTEIALEQTEIAEAERIRAETREKEATAQREIAEQERIKAEQAREAEEYESYVAKIGLAAAKVDENAFSDAMTLLLQCPESLRNWEWGRLMYLCSQSKQTYLADAPVEGLALGPEAVRFVTASWDGVARIWDRDSGQVLFELPHESIYVHSVDWSAVANLIVTGSADKQNNVKLWNPGTGQLISQVNGHDAPVIGVRFSDDGRWLISCSYDNTAKLWDLKTPSQPELTTTLVGHNWWVWDADFEPGFDPSTERNRIVTAGHDKKAIVWEISEQGRKAKPLIEFLEHAGAIYTVAFHPDGQRIATGGYDHKVHLWNPDQIEPFDFNAAVAGVERIEQEFETFSGHIGPVRCLEFSDSGELLLSGSQDNSVRVWQVDSGVSIKTFRGHDSAVRACGISADSKYVFTGSEDERAIFWSVNDYAEIETLAGKTLTGHADAILSAYFSPDGKELLTASRDRSARIWNVSDGQQVQLLAEGHRYLSSSAVFLDGERFIATAAADNTVRIWNSATGSEVRHLQGTGRSSLLAVSDDERWLATGSEQDTLLIWDTEQLLRRDESEPEPVAELTGHKHPITAIAFVPGSSQLVSGDTHGRCSLWETANATQVWSVRNHTKKISAISFVDDGQLVLTASLDRTIGVSAVSTGVELTEQVRSLPAAIIAMDVSQDGRYIVAEVSQTDGESEQSLTVARWDRQQAGAEQLWTFPNVTANDLQLNADGTLAYLTCGDNTLKRLDLRSGEMSVVIDGSEHGGLMWSSLLSDDGRRLLTIGGVDARLWDLRTGQERMSFGPHGAVAATAMSPSGKTVVTGSWDQSLKFWDVATGQTTRKISQAHNGFINSVAYSHDGRMVVTAGDDRVAKLWDAQTGQLLREFIGHTGDIHRAIFSPDDRTVLTTSGDRTLRLWDCQNAEQLGEPFVGHRWAILAADFSPDGSRVVSCSEDNNAILWDVATREPVVSLSGHTAAVTSACFSPDGLRVLTSSRDNTAKLWDVSPDHEGKEILTLKRHAQEVTAVDFSDDALTAMTASRDGTAVLWPARDWRQPLPPEFFRQLQRSKKAVIPKNETQTQLPESTKLNPSVSALVE